MKNVLFLAMVAVLLLLAACSDEEAGSKEVEVDKDQLENLTDSGMPIVEEKITFDVFAASDPSDNWNDILIWNEYEEMTNIEINWEQVPNASLEEKRNLILASDNLPDAFYAAGLNNLDLFKYGEQGVFIPLNDLIEKHAPNLTKLIEEYPEVRKSITFPDGNIYALPTIQDPEFQSLLVGARPWFNQEWLDTLGMEIPETTEEFYNYLKAVKEDDPNGNGKADEIPYGGRYISELVRWLRGSYGLSEQNQTYIDRNPENEEELRFIPTSDQYKEMLQFIRKLYDEELIIQNIFTIENNQFLADGAEGKYGSTVFYAPDETFGEAGKAFTGGTALKGPHGDQSFSISNPVGRVDGMVITNKNENPAATVRWIDHFYSDEGAKFQYMGIEGETFEETGDDEYEYVDEITNSSDGLTLDQEISKRLAWVGIWPPGIMKQEYFMGSETTQSSLDATEKLTPYITEESWPAFTYTEDESKKLSALAADIEKYVEEMRDKFIVGDIPFSEWDNYVETIENMGLEEYMNIKKAAFERYESN